MTHWFNLPSGSQRQAAKLASSPDQDEDERRRLIGAPVNSRRRRLRKLQREPIDQLRKRLLKTVDELHERFANK